MNEQDLGKPKNVFAFNSNKVNLVQQELPPKYIELDNESQKTDQEKN